MHKKKQFSFQANARLYNSDLPYAEVLNSYFSRDTARNEEIVRQFAASGELHDEFADHGGSGRADDDE
jgi:hypothetical protein